MTDKQILDGNLLIARFMNKKPDSNGEYDYSEFHGITDEGTGCLCVWPEHHIMYHESYDWVMTVLKEIQKIGTYDYSPNGSRITSRPMINISMREIEIYYHFKGYDSNKMFHIAINSTGTGYVHPMYKMNKFIKLDFNKISLIEAIWIACIEFIKWHNKQKL